MSCLVLQVKVANLTLSGPTTIPVEVIGTKQLTGITADFGDGSTQDYNISSLSLSEE